MSGYSVGDWGCNPNPIGCPGDQSAASSAWGSQTIQVGLGPQQQSDKLTAAEIAQLFRAGGLAPLATSLLGDDGLKYAIADILAQAKKSIPPTSNTLEVIGGQIVSTVNGIASSIPATAIVDSAYSAAPATPVAGAAIYGPGGKSYTLVQDVSSTGILLPTWSTR
jgi:hypothetical protein